MQTPVSLLQRFRQPDHRAAWDEFVEIYAPILYTWARQANLNESDAADLVQEVFLVLLRELPRFEYDPQRRFRAWLKTITLNKRNELLRRRRPDIGLAIEPATSDPIEEFWEQEYREHLCRQTLAFLEREFRPDTWQAFWLTTFEGHSIEAVAERLGKSPAVVTVARHRVLRRLQDRVTDLLE